MKSQSDNNPWRRVWHVFVKHVMAKHGETIATKHSVLVMCIGSATSGTGTVTLTGV